MKKLEYIIFALLTLALGAGVMINTGCSNLSVSPTSGLEEDYTLLTDKVDRLFAKWDKSDSPGAAVVILKNSKIVHQKGYGIANLEHGVPITPATIFDVASVSKQFTAMAIAILAEQEKISLDDEIGNYLPDIPDFGKTITIRHLLHHTSGLRSWGFLMQLEGWSGMTGLVMPISCNWQEIRKNLISSQEKNIPIQIPATFYWPKLWRESQVNLFAKQQQPIFSTPWV